MTLNLNIYLNLLLKSLNLKYFKSKKNHFYYKNVKEKHPPYLNDWYEYNYITSLIKLNLIDLFFRIRQSSHNTSFFLWFWGTVWTTCTLAKLGTGLSFIPTDTIIFLASRFATSTTYVSIFVLLLVTGIKSVRIFFQDSFDRLISNI